MMKNIMAKKGDRVDYIGIGQGTIINIRYDSDNREIYTIKLDSNGEIMVARHEELKWL